MPYAIRYYRDEDTAQRYLQHGVFKPSGMVTSSYGFEAYEDAEAEAQAVNQYGPEFPCVVTSVMVDACLSIAAAKPQPKKRGPAKTWGKL